MSAPIKSSRSVSLAAASAIAVLLGANSGAALAGHHHRCDNCGSGSNQNSITVQTGSGLVNSGPPLHGPGSSHNPTLYHPVHGLGSSHNPIARSLGKTVIRDHRKRPCYFHCNAGRRPNLTNAEGSRAVTKSTSSRYNGGDTSRDHRH